MQDLETIPLFRTEPVQVLVIPTAAAVEMPAATTIGDLTDYLGHHVDSSTWAELQTECKRRHDGLFTIYAHPVGNAYHIYRIHVKPNDTENAD